MSDFGLMRLVPDAPFSFCGHLMSVFAYDFRCEGWGLMLRVFIQMAFQWLGIVAWTGWIGRRLGGRLVFRNFRGGFLFPAPVFAFSATNLKGTA